jgi:hypothetical protein
MPYDPTGEQLHPTSTFKEFGSAADHLRVRDEMRYRQESSQTLYDLIKPSDEVTKPYKEVIDVIQDNLIRKYKLAGIDIKKEDFPTVQLKMLDSFTRVDSEGNSQNKKLGGEYDPHNHELTLFVRGEKYFFLEILYLHHELHHSLGKKLRVIGKTSPKDRPYYHAAKSGYRTGGLGVKPRGVALEEGFVEYHARNFALYSDHPLIVQAREQYALSSLDEDKKTEPLTEDQIHEQCRAQLFEDAPNSYNISYAIVRLILDRAEDTMGEEYSSVLYDLLLAAREDVKYRRLLVREIDTLFSNTSKDKRMRIGRLLFAIDFSNEDALFALYKKMKESLSN